MLPLFDVVVSPEFRRSLWIVAGAVFFVLLMASVSAAALLLTRASSRQRELAVRVALGASRGSLVRLLLMESLVLGVLSGLTGLVVAASGVALLQSTGAASVPRLDEIALRGRVFTFAAAATLLSALGAGLLPAWRSTRGLHEMLRSRGEVSAPAATRTLHTLVLVEVASAVLLVVGAALLAQTVLNLHWRDLGFDRKDLVAIDAIWPSMGESDLVARTDDALSRVAALPGVSRVAAVSALPFSGRNSGDIFQIEGQSVRWSAAPRRRLPRGLGRLLRDRGHSRVVRPGLHRCGRRAARRGDHQSNGGAPILARWQCDRQAFEDGSFGLAHHRRCRRRRTLSRS